jgi:hypothetical protein
VGWKVTVRHGSRVGREKFATLDSAMEGARRRVEEVRGEDRLPGVRSIRDFGPAERVQARIEISGPGLIRSPEGGIDVMGDGHAVAYTGTIRKRTIEADSLDDAFERLRNELDSSRG